MIKYLVKTDHGGLAFNLRNLIRIMGVLFFLSPVFIFAQQIEIRAFILEHETNNPIEGANINVKNRDIGTTSDSDGFFLLRLPLSFKNDTLIISYLGFLDYEQPVSAFKKNQIIQLHPDILQLERAISVIADKIDLVRREIPHASYTIELDEIQRLGSSEISDVFKAIPSVRIEGNDLDGRTIQIRGSNPDEVNVYLDGVLINNLRFDHVADLSMIATEDIEKLEVLKGGNLMLLGQGAFGGVVNISTRKSFEPAYALKIKGGSFKTRYGLASLNIPLSAKTSLSYFGQLNFMKPEIEFFPGEKYAPKTPNAEIESRKQNHHLDANFILGDGHLNTKAMGYLLDYEKPGWENRYYNYILSGSYKGNIFSLSDIDMSVNYLYGDNQIIRAESESSAYRSAYLSKRLNGRFAESFTFGNMDLQFLSEYFHDELVSTSDLSKNTVTRTIYQGEVYDNRLAVAGVFAFRDTLSTQRNVSWNTYIGLRYDILANGRRDFTQSYGVQFSIIAAKWTIRPYGSYGKNVKYPTLLQNAFIQDLTDFLHEDSTGMRLEPEFNNSGELGVGLTYTPETTTYRSLMIDFAWFTSVFYNKLLTRPFDLVIAQAQIGRSTTSGWEASVRLHRLMNTFTLGISAMKLNIADPFLYPYKPEENYSIQFEIQFGFGLYLHSLSYYQGKSTAWYYDQDDQFITRTLDPFYDIDISVGYRLKIDPLMLEMQLAGYNMLDNSGYTYYTLNKRYIQASFAIRY